MNRIPPWIISVISTVGINFGCTREVVDEICCNPKTTVHSLAIQPLGRTDTSRLIAGCEWGHDLYEDANVVRNLNIEFHLRHDNEMLREWCREKHQHLIGDREDLLRRMCDYIRGYCYWIRTKSEGSVIILSQRTKDAKNDYCYFGDGAVAGLVGPPEHASDADGNERAFLLAFGFLAVNDRKFERNRFSYVLVFKPNPAYLDALAQFGLDKWWVVIDASCECEPRYRRLATEEGCTTNELWNLIF